MRERLERVSEHMSGWRGCHAISAHGGKGSWRVKEKERERERKSLVETLELESELELKLEVW